ncbi:hypothetical protein I6B53_08840 [Schaalia sp. 19OD2882]|nr:CshA/CshB family fibrillar adhesin-related protein [Schaalia sp. 19OD2882]QWW20740.1 hypothetical protein I6B53_08840 [Schaalia sp. 19OD2882]
MCAASVLALPWIASPTHAEDAPVLDAVFATGGSGRYVDTIQWLQWADYSEFAGKAKPRVPVLDYGATKEIKNRRDLGDAGVLTTSCTLSNLTYKGHGPDAVDAQAKGPLVATVPGTWAGDGLDNLYNVNGPGQWVDGSATWHPGLTYPTDYVNNNQMVIGLANGYAYNGTNALDGKPWGTPGSDPTPTGYTSRVSVDYACSAELRTPQGVVLPVPIKGLVFADAEASSRRYGIKSWADTPRQDEWVSASTTDPVTWRVLDTLRSHDCISKTTGKQVTTTVDLEDGGRTARLMPSDEECVYQKDANGTAGQYERPNGLGGPDVVMLMEGATKATVTLQGSGYSAVALGLIVATDFGDAPKSYGYAGSLFQPKWEGGEVTWAGGTPGTYDGADIRSTDAFAVSPLASMRLGEGGPRLGEIIDAEGYQDFSATAKADDDNAVFDDEDSIDTTAWNHGYKAILTALGKVYRQPVRCSGVGKVAGWIDWNNDGHFDEATEKSDEVACAAGGALISWTVPSEVTNTKRSVDGEPGSLPDSYMRVRITDDNGGVGQRAIGITSSGEVEDYKVSIRVPTLTLEKKVDNTWAGALGLAPDQWSVSAKGPRADLTLSGAGSTGNPQTVVPGRYDLAEKTTNPDAAGYTTGTWTCVSTPGTVADPNSPFSSTVGATNAGGAATATVRNEDRVSCRITNTAKPGSLTWGKVDEDGTTRIGGSQWRLRGPGHPAGLLVDDCTQGPCTGPDTDPTAGSFRVTNLKWGDYTVEETRAPIGHIRSEASFAFTRITGRALEATLVPAQGVKDGAVVNARMTGSVTWLKVDADIPSNRLAGSAWSLSGPKVPANTVVTDCVSAPCAGGPYTDQDPAPGVFTVKGLTWSQDPYSLVEKEAPVGYVLDTTPHPFTIAKDALEITFSDPIVNAKTTVPAIPLTGGSSADAYLIAGGALLVTAAGAGVVARRRLARA